MPIQTLRKLLTDISGNSAANRRRNVRRKSGATPAADCEVLQSRQMLSADAGADLSTMNDEFDDAASLTEWNRIHETEGWNADQLQAWNIDTDRPGQMVMQPHSVVWYQNWRGPLAYKEVTGNFIFTSQIFVSDRDDIGNSDADSIPNDASFSLGGLMIRTPRGISDPAVDWQPGSMLDDNTNSGENYVFLSMGHGVDGQMSFEVKTTRNSDSQLELTPLGDNIDTATLRIARIDSSVITMYRLPGQDWTIHRRYSRPDMPSTLQVGLVSYSDWDKAGDFDPFVHNSTTLQNGIDDPTPDEPFNPDIVVGYEYARFVRPDVPSELAGVDLAASATVEQLLSFLAEPAQPTDGDILQIADQVMPHTQDVLEIDLPADVNGESVTYSAEIPEKAAGALNTAHNLYDFTENYAFNWGGLNEKWLRGDSGYYYLLPSGEVYLWQNSFQDSQLLETLDQPYYEDPSRLINAQPTPVEVSVDGHTLVIDPQDDFSGSFVVHAVAHVGDVQHDQDFRVDVLNSAPVISPVGNQATTPHGQLSIAIQATDPDGDDVFVEGRLIAVSAFEARQSWDLHAAAGVENFAYNWGGQNEKWIQGSEGWYYLLPGGVLNLWEGSFESSSHRRTLSDDYYQNPQLLLDATVPDTTLNVVDGQLVVMAGSQPGLFPVEVFASDGLLTSRSEFLLTVQNQAPQLSVDDVELGVHATLVISDYAADPDGHSLNLSAWSEGSREYALQSTWEFHEADGVSNYALNWGGQNEKWFQGTNGWTYILPDGGIYDWEDGFDGSPLLGHVSESVWTDPTLLFNAEAPIVTADVENGQLVIRSNEQQGSTEITLQASDGFETTSTTIMATVSDSSPADGPLPVLMVIANRDFYYQEYGDTRESLEADGLEVVVAAATTDVARPHGNSGQGADGGYVTPDLALSDVEAEDYSAIVFIGGWGSSSYQYAFEGTYSYAAYNGSEELRQHTNDLINDFVEQDKYVTAICHGVSVLAWARVDGASLLDDVTVSAWADAAPSSDSPLQTTRAHIEFNGGTQVASGSVGDPNTVEDDVIVDGRIITAENYDSAAHFGRVIADKLRAEHDDGSGDPGPVLMVIANQDFYYQEYSDTRASLEADGLEVVVAAATTDVARPHGNSGQGADGGYVTPDLALSDAEAEDYSAIVFVGGWGSSSYQYAFEGTYSYAAYNGSEALRQHTNDLVNDFVEQDKYVTAICHGVSVLAWARVDGASLLDDVTVSAWADAAPSSDSPLQTTRAHIEFNGGTQVASGSVGDPNTAEDDVIVDGRIITAENYNSARLFGSVLSDLVFADWNGTE